jgi:hypothetical protein
MAQWITQAIASSHLSDASFDALYLLPDEASRLARDVSAAETEVLSHLRRYRLPVTDPDAVSFLSSLALDIFAAIAWRHSAGDQIPAKYADAAKHARAILGRIASGDLTLAGVAAAESADGSASLVIAGNEPQFDRASMEEF